MGHRRVVSEDAAGIGSFDCPKCGSRQVRAKGEALGSCTLCGVAFWGRVRRERIESYPPRPTRAFQPVEWRRSGGRD